MEPFAIVKHFDVTEQEVLGFSARGRNAVAQVIETLGLEHRNTRS